MIAGRVLGAVGAVVDWSLIHLLAAVSDRVEGRGADCYRRADALADMEAGREVWEAGEIAKAVDLMNAETKAMARTMRVPMALFLDPDEHGFSGECPAEGSSCGCGRSAAVTTPAADNTTDHVTALLNYHIPMVVSSGFWGCEGCSWIGPKTGHTRHLAELITDMTAATGRVQQKLGGAP